MFAVVLGIYGASGLGTELYGLAKVINEQYQKWEQFVFIDDDPQKVGTCLGELAIKSFSQSITDYGKTGIEFIIGIGEPATKEIVFRKLENEGCLITRLIHPSYKGLGMGARAGKGLVVHCESSMPPFAQYGNNVLIQRSAIMGHNIELGDNVVISALDFIGGDTKIGKNTYIAPHCSIRNGVHIGENCIIGMGSVVTKDIPDNAVAYGNPCKVVRINEGNRVFSK